MKKLILIALILNVVILAGHFWRQSSVAEQTQFAVENGDVNGDLAIDISDPVYLLLYLFKEGNPPVAIAQENPELESRVAALEAVHSVQEPPSPDPAVSLDRRMFLRVDQIDGGSEVEGREGWIDVVALDESVTLGAGGVLRLLVAVDQAAPLLVGRAYSASPISDVSLTMERLIPGGASTEVFYSIKLDSATVQSYRVLASGLHAEVAFCYDRAEHEWLAGGQVLARIGACSSGVDSLGTSSTPLARDPEVPADRRIFLNLDGISGGSEAPRRSGWIDVLAVDERVTESAAGELRLLVAFDQSAPVLIDNAFDGSILERVRVEMERLNPDEGSRETYYSIELAAATVKRYRILRSGLHAEVVFCYGSIDHTWHSGGQIRTAVGACE